MIVNVWKIFIKCFFWVNIMGVGDIVTIKVYFITFRVYVGLGVKCIISVDVYFFD